MPARSRFRPCIDLHNGVVKQIVGGSLSDRDPSLLKTNFVSKHSPAYYAHLFKDNNFTGGHVIKLGPGNDEAAKETLAEWPNGFHLGGGINDENALEWIEAGAEKVIVTSYLFPSSRFSLERLERMTSIVGKERLVIDISCRRKGDKWYVAMNRWQDLTDMEVNQISLELLSHYCSEFLIHAADVEGLCGGIDEELVKVLGQMVTIPTTYAGGAKSLSDLDLVDRLSGGKVDLTYGRQVIESGLLLTIPMTHPFDSALDIFGGELVKFTDLIKRHRADNYNQDTGEPLRSSAGILGCPSGTRCPFVHPDSPNWRRAPKSKLRRGYSRDPSPYSTSSHNPSRLPPPDRHRYNDHPELSSRISDAKELGSLRARLTDPEDLPPSESLVSRISEPQMSGWASHAMNISSSTWDSTSNEDVAPWSSPVTTKPKQFAPHNRPVPTAPASIRNAFGSTAQQRTDNQEIALPPSSLPGPSSASNKNVSMSSPQPPVAPALAHRISTSVPPSPVAVKHSPAFSPKPVPQSPIAPNQPSLSPTVAPLPFHPLSHESGQLPSPILPPRSPPPPLPSQPIPSFLPPTTSSASTSPVQHSTLDIRASSMPRDLSLSTPTATIQSPLSLRPHSPDRQHTEAKGKNVSPEQRIVENRLSMISKTVWCYQELKKAEAAVSWAHTERYSYKSHHIGEGAQKRLQHAFDEANLKARDANRRFDKMILKFLESELWPTSLPQDSRVELLSQQIQDLQKQFTDISDKLAVEDTSSGDSVIAEQIIAQRNSSIEQLTQLDSRQDDVENSIDQRLHDLERKQESVLSDLLAKAQTREKQEALEAKMLKEQLNHLAHQLDTFSQELSECYKRQADTIHRLSKLQEENEQLKKQLVIYEERDLRLRSEFQAFRDSFDLVKAQQTLRMQEGIDQRLLDSMKTSMLMQVNGRIEERFRMIEQELELHMASTRDLTTREFKVKYDYVIEFLDHLRDYLHSSTNVANGDITCK